MKDALMAVDYGADAIGFVLAKSKRQISLNQAKKIIKNLPPFVTTVAVIVNENKGNLNKIINAGIFDAIQLHGEETPGTCHYLKNKIKVIKALRVKDKKSFRNISTYKVDAILLDTFSKQAQGGTGRVFNWNLAKEIKNRKVPLILSGGLNPNNVGKALKKVKPYAVDASGGLERYPGKKDKALVKKFIEEVKKN